MKRQELIKLFVQLGQTFGNIGSEKEWSGFDSGITESEHDALNTLVARQMSYNGWFTKENVYQSFNAWSNLLTEEKLIAWTNNYTFSDNPKRVAVIMAGNIPLVGFHDFLSVILSGNVCLAKMSSDDKTLLPFLCDLMVQWNPEFKQHFELSLGGLKNIEAVIATGSNNSQLYFEQYFGKHPHIFRKNRTSIAVLNGKETKEELHALGHDIFDYFGLGCRNVSHLILPKGYELSTFFEGIFDHNEVVLHKKYGNNYDYNKAIFLMNQTKLLDNNFVLLMESDDLHSQLAMVHYHFYETQDELDRFIEEHREEIQTIVGSGFSAFGSAQQPELDDYADGVNTLEWLAKL